MFKKTWIVACMLAALMTAPNYLYAQDTKLSALPSATLTEADELYINDGGVSKKATIAELRTVVVGTGYIRLNITALREIGTDTTNEIGDTADGTASDPYGGLLAADTTPRLLRSNLATDKALKVEWIGGNVDEVQFASVPMPPDLDSTVDVTIHLLAKMSTSGDTPTIDVQVFDGIGDTEMGGATAALSDTLAELIVTIANADISGGPLGFFNIILIPGAHATQLVELYVVWIEYTRKAPA
jgi:hypothetical protein